MRHKVLAVLMEPKRLCGHNVVGSIKAMVAIFSFNLEPPEIQTGFFLKSHIFLALIVHTGRAILEVTINMLTFFYSRHDNQSTNRDPFNIFDLSYVNGECMECYSS